MDKLLRQAFTLFEQENVAYCLLRGVELKGTLQGGDIDLLVARDDLERVRKVLVRLGFVRLPAWGHAPHHFFVAYAEDSDCWFKLDVVTDIAYGRPIHALYTPLAETCLHNRHREDHVFVLSPEDELITLLLHCVVDKGDISAGDATRLTFLCDHITQQSYVTALLSTLVSPRMTFRSLAALVESADWKDLLASREAVITQLKQQGALGALVRQARDRFLRKLHRAVRLFRPYAFTIALLAPDGAGKSTLAASLQKSFFFPVRLLYMGLYSAQRQSGSAVVATRVPHAPGLGLLRHLCIRWYRYLIARYHQAHERLVIFDRYSYDSLLPLKRPQGRMGLWRRWLLARACPRPELVLLLDAPGRVLFARKGEKNEADLEQQRQGYLDLQSKLKQMIIIDATRDPDDVRRQATLLIWDRYASRLGAPRHPNRLERGT